MKVIAIAKGFRGKLYEPGETFDVPEGTKGSWFVPAELQPEAKSAKVAKPAKAEKAAEGGDLV